MDVTFGIILIIEVFITLWATGEMALEPNPFFPITKTWERTNDLNIAGRIIATTLVAIVTLPAMCIGCLAYIAIIVAVGMREIFKLAFKKRS